MSLNKKIPSVVLGIILAINLSGCAGIVAPEQNGVAATLQTVIRQTKSAGQTFVARQAGLTGIEIFLTPLEAGTGELHLRLRADALTSADLTTTSLPLTSITTAGYYRFAFSPQSDSRQHYYYAEWTLTGTGAVLMGRTGGEAYLDGSAYQNGLPDDAQVAFRLIYQPGQAWLGWAYQGVIWGLLIIVAIGLYILPGWALLGLIQPTAARLIWPEKMGLAIGLSLTLYPLLMLWTHLIGLNLGPLYAWLPLGAGSVYALKKMQLGWPKLALWRNSEAMWPDLALLGVMGLIFATRFWVVRQLDAPLWGDSVQHTFITQLLIDHGGLFSSWAPYADLQSFTYHFGFHAAIAALHWITQMDVLQSVLWGGQLLNGLAAVALYPLATWLTGRRWAGVGAVLTAGLLLSMPMFYVNWGRYTQLAGQIILPAAMCLAWIGLEESNPRWLILASLAWSGLVLAHYRILVLAGGFLLAWFVFQKLWQWRLLKNTLLFGAGAALLVMPWLINAFSGKLWAYVYSFLTTPAVKTSQWMQDMNAGVDPAIGLPTWIWLALALIIGWGLWQRQRAIAILGLWCLVAGILTNPQWLNLPGEGAINNFTLFIAAYLPAAVLFGNAFDWALARMPKFNTSLVWLMMVMAGAVWGAGQRINDVQPSAGTLLTRPDLRAAAWIRANTPPTARFAINSFDAFGASVVVAADGGWWLPLLTQRGITVPPINYFSETGPTTTYREEVNALNAQIHAQGITHPDTLARLQTQGVCYIYLGQRQGRMNYSGPVLEPAQLLSSPVVRLIYQQDRVYIFILNTPPCQRQG